MRRSTLIITPVLAALLGITAGCGDDDGDAPARAEPTGGNPRADAFRVVESDFDLNPANPQIERAGSLSFDVLNRGESVHALKIEAPGGEFETPTIGPGQSQTLEAKLPAGRYTWYCPVANHRELGMTGTITVSDSASGSGSAEPEDRGKPGGGGGYGY